MLTQLSDLISLSLVALTEVFCVADEGFSKRPSQHLVFHPPCEEKSSSHIWSERTDDDNNNDNNNNNTRCVLLVWRITEAQWVHRRLFKEAERQIYWFLKAIKRKKVLKMTDDDALKSSLSWNECVEWRMLPLRDDYFGI